MTKTTAILANVKIADGQREVMSGRAGTVMCSLYEFQQRFGKPHWSIRPIVEGEKPNYDKPTDIKVSNCWYIDTPRGPAEIRDYWWNPVSELSIAGPYRRALWVAAWLRAQGVGAGLGAPSPLRDTNPLWHKAA